MADDDAQDERIRAELEVEPLDEVTRRRLVSTALAATELPSTDRQSTHRETAADARTARWSHAARWIAAAAAIVVVLVAAVALLTAPGGNDEQQASTPPRSPVAQEKSAGAAADSGAPAPAPPVAVGDFGDLDVPANLARLRAALESGTAPSAAATAQSGLTEAAGGAAVPCRGELPSGTVTASATGTLDGRRAVVVITTLPDGSRSIDAVLTSPCEVRPLS